MNTNISQNSDRAFEKPFISVILPVYNAEHFVMQAIESILNQTYSDFELILVNDGSIDKSKEIILSFHDSRIIYLENENNCGLIYSLNSGIHHSKGKYIARMDADDISVPDRFYKQVVYLESHPNCAVVGSAYLPIDIRNLPLMKPITRPLFSTTNEWFMIIGCPVAHPSVMYRTDIAKRVGGYNSYFVHAEDYEFWTRMIQYGQIVSIPDVLLWYRGDNQNRISEKYSIEQTNKTNEIRCKYYSDHFGKDMPLSISQIIQNPSSIGNDKDRYEACIFLYNAYQQVLTSNKLTHFERGELNDHVFHYISLIANRITSDNYFIKISKKPLEIKHSNRANRFLLRLFHLVRNKVKPIIKNILIVIGAKKEIKY